ncbi:MAG TPA: hypothetical protein ENI37_07890 [Chloroflexi bacterium]|nr:hypothetical protein [Chloroflexota bacterium]
MNTLNRVLVVLTVLVSLVVCVTVFVAPISTLRAVSGGLDGAASYLEGIPGWLRVVLGVLFALAWLVVCILFLILELRQPRLKMVRLEKVGGGEAEVSLGTVAEHVAYEIDQLPGVLRARPRVSARKNGVVVEVEVDTAGDVEVPARAAQVVEVVRRVVEEKVGVKLAQPPKVRLRAAPVPPGVRSRAGSRGQGSN